MFDDFSFEEIRSPRSVTSRKKQKSKKKKRNKAKKVSLADSPVKPKNYSRPQIPAISIPYSQPVRFLVSSAFTVRQTLVIRMRVQTSKFHLRSSILRRLRLPRNILRYRDYVFDRESQLDEKEVSSLVEEEKDRCCFFSRDPFWFTPGFSSNSSFLLLLHEWRRQPAGIKLFSCMFLI